MIWGTNTSSSSNSISSLWGFFIGKHSIFPPLSSAPSSCSPSSQAFFIQGTHLQLLLNSNSSRQKILLSLPSVNEASQLMCSVCSIYSQNPGTPSLPQHGQSLCCSQENFFFLCLFDTAFLRSSACPSVNSKCWALCSTVMSLEVPVCLQGRGSSSIDHGQIYQSLYILIQIGGGRESLNLTGVQY